jgi:hypothetical protein
MRWKGKWILMDPRSQGIQNCESQVEGSQLKSRNATDSSKAPRYFQASQFPFDLKKLSVAKQRFKIHKQSH